MPSTNYALANSATSNSSTQNAVVASPGGLQQALVGCLFTGTAQAVTSGTGASSWVPTGRGPSGVSTPTIPANYLVAGKTLRLRIMGQMVTQATPGTVTLGLALGTSTLWTTAANTPTVSLSQGFSADVLVTCLTAGASGTCAISGQISYDTGNISGIDTLFAVANTGVAINTTISNLLAVTTTNSVSGGTVFTINSFLLEALN